MSRFPPLTNTKNNTATESINWGDLGDFRNRETVKPRSSSKRLQAVYDAQSGDVPAAYTGRKGAAVAPLAQAKPKSAQKAKSAELLALEANADRAFKVVKDPSALGKMKAAAELLGTTKLSAEEIIIRLPSCQTDDVREKAEIDALWTNAGAKVYGRGVDAPHAPDVLLRAAAKVNAINGFAGEAA